MSQRLSFKQTFRADTETLETCPGWEQRKYVSFGATLIGARRSAANEGCAI